MALQKPKVRLDRLLIAKGLASTQEKAKALIFAGLVRVNSSPALKPGKIVDPEVPLEVKKREHPYVSRGGLKLEKALTDFQIEVQNKTALDIGVSTGGFTHCLLLRKISKVYAVDVGYGQLAWEIRQNPKVKVMERKNARFLTRSDIGKQVDLIVVDASFISLKLIIPPLIPILKNQGDIVALVKPQFEVGKGKVGKGGVVRDEKDHDTVLENLSLFCRTFGLSVLGTIESPIKGAKGNKEFFIHLRLEAEGDRTATD